MPDPEPPAALSARALTEQGMALLDQGRLFEATAALEQALSLEPDNVNALANLAMTWGKLGRIDEATALAAKVQALLPQSTGAKIARIQLMNYDPASGAADALALARSLWHPHGKIKARRRAAHTPDPAAAEKPRLKIGYVSTDLFSHPVGRLLLPVVTAHDRERFEIFRYADNANRDAVTDALTAQCDTWCDIAGQPDDAVLDRIAADGIDILVDLAGHMTGNRLRVFHNTPAPVQITWLGYCGTTGLDVMDYMVVDRNVVRPGEEQFYTEQPLFMPDALLCYAGALNAPAVAPPPHASSGTVTFGSFNNPSKFSPQVIRLWARLLNEVPGSKLVLKYLSLSDPAAAQTAVRQFTEQGVPADKLVVLGNTSNEAHLAAYAQVDIALDPFPYNGTMTTLDALWMGVPVITLDGGRWVARMTASLLRTAGLEDFIARTEDEYVSLAAGLARQPEHLTALRRNLRATVASSPLADADNFTRALENHYRDVWRRWCEG